MISKNHSTKTIQHFERKDRTMQPHLKKKVTIKKKKNNRRSTTRNQKTQKYAMIWIQLDEMNG